VREGAHTAPDGERLYVFRASIDATLAALNAGGLHNGPLLVALQWLALNRDRIATLLGR
jgi:hypothetical protein